jgi:hypothetical protein
MRLVLKVKHHRASWSKTMALQSLGRLNYTEKYERFLSLGKIESHLHEFVYAQKYLRHC